MERAPAQLETNKACPYCEQPLEGPAGFCPVCGLSLPKSYARAGPEYASIWRRGVAHLVDAAIGTAGMALAAVPLTVAFRMPSVAGAPLDFRHGLQVMQVFLAAAIAAKLLSWLYFTVFESSAWQATPGKRLLGMTVTDLDGARIGFLRANKRYWAKLVSDILYVGYFAALMTERKQALHDLAAKTLVVRR